MGSALIQYKLDLFAAGLQDTGSAISVATRIQALKDHQSAWRAFRWSEQHEIKLGLLRPVCIREGVLACTTRYKDHIRFFRLPSILRGIEKKEWTVTVNKLPSWINAYAMDPLEDLFVSVEGMRGM